jgi:hypothetical protein
MEAHFATAAECAMGPSVSLSLMTKRYHMGTGRILLIIVSLEETFLKAQGFLHIEYDGEGMPKLHVNVISACT